MPAPAVSRKLALHSPTPSVVVCPPGGRPPNRRDSLPNRCPPSCPRHGPITTSRSATALAHGSCGARPRFALHRFLWVALLTKPRNSLVYGARQAQQDLDADGPIPSLTSSSSTPPCMLWPPTWTCTWQISRTTGTDAKHFSIGTSTSRAGTISRPRFHPHPRPPPATTTSSGILPRSSSGAVLRKASTSSPHAPWKTIKTAKHRDGGEPAATQCGACSPIRESRPTTPLSQRT